MCCGGASTCTKGCLCEATHTTDVEWWRAYVHLPPAMPGENDCESDSWSEGEAEDDDDDALEALQAMDIS